MCAFRLLLAFLAATDAQHMTFIRAMEAKETMLSKEITRLQKEVIDFLLKKKGKCFPECDSSELILY